MVKQAGIIFAIACVFAAATSAAIWHVVRPGSSSRDFAVKAITATVNHPVAVEVRLLGSVISSSGVIACSKKLKNRSI